MKELSQEGTKGGSGPREPASFASSRLPVISIFCIAMLLAACGRGDAPRCPECGMVIHGSPRWNAGLTTRDGKRRTFDTPRCMLRYARSAAGRGAKDAWVRDYYGQRRIPAARARFVVGSDVLGPMGPDVVPLADLPAAERFGEEHGGRAILSFDEIRPDDLRGR